MGASRYPDRPVVAVAAVVVKDDAVLLVQRGRAPNLGIWAIPGGSLELGESLQQGAEREVLEETGVRVRAGRVIYAFDSVERDEAGVIRYHYVVVDLLAEYLSGEPIANDDAADARWVTAAELGDMEVSAKTLELLRNTLSFGTSSDS